MKAQTIAEDETETLKKLEILRNPDNDIKHRIAGYDWLLEMPLVGSLKTSRDIHAGIMRRAIREAGGELRAFGIVYTLRGDQIVRRLG